MTPIREDGSPKAQGQYLRFLALAAAILLGLFALGYQPTARLAGEEGVSAMAAGGGVGLMGSVAGTLPFLLSRSRTQVEVVPVVMGSIALRLAVVVLLAAAVVLSGAFATRPLVVWVAISHACLLVADTIYARGQIRAKTAIKVGGGA